MYLYAYQLLRFQNNSKPLFWTQLSGKETVWLPRSEQRILYVSKIEESGRVRFFQKQSIPTV